LSVSRVIKKALKPPAEPPIRNLVDETKDAWVPLGTLLLRVGAIDPEQLEIALTEKERSPRRLGEILVEWGWVSSVEIARALAEQYGMPFLDLSQTEVEQEAAMLLSEEAARRLQALPIRFLPDRLLLVGLVDPTDVLAAEELRSLLGTGVCLNVVDIAALESAFARLYGERVLAD
jgi:Type II secretion system (T2SS), protein E, N-terminal domain